MSTRLRSNRTHYQRYRIGDMFRREVQRIGKRMKRTGLHPSWVLLSALLALMIGLFLERAALAATDRRPERAAVLLILYGIAVIWLHISPAVLRWWNRTRRAIPCWQPARTRKK